jgi:hypothetical protein
MTPILYTSTSKISDKLKLTIIENCFTVENLTLIKEYLESSNADFDGLHSPLISEIKQILKTDKEVISYHNDI